MNSVSIDRIDLRDTTFIIPIRIESEDRAFNFRFVLQWLLRHLDTNIIVYESDKQSPGNEILKDIIRCGQTGGSSIRYFCDLGYNEAFHRTRMLNFMIQESQSPIVVNYDCDVLLEPETYKQAAETIRNGIADFCYPYFLGMSQRMVNRNGAQLGETLREMPQTPGSSVAGHCFFARRSAYINAGMENEHFISYNPEDAERLHRFKILGYEVRNLDSLVYHIEHSRGVNSSKDNPHFAAGNKLYQQLISMPEPELMDYYKNASYTKKYNLNP